MASRAVCERCRRPQSVCYCAYIQQLPTRTRVLLLQHPRERHVAIGTARMAHLALPNSALRPGLDFSVDEVVRAAIAESPPPFVLFPGPNAHDAAELPKDRPITLIVLDGTWSQAKKLLRRNPCLTALPQVAFTPRRASAYRIRRQPAEFCVSTIEALAEVLPLIEPGAPSFERLLDPFHAMVARQERFAIEVASGRHRRPAARSDATELDRPRRDSAGLELGAELAAAWPRLVCVYGEANAWPKRDRRRPEPEIVRWLGFRPATGQTYDVVVAPRQPVAPAVPERIGLSLAALQAGDAVDTWQRSWAVFCAPDDVIVTWGPYHIRLALAAGLGLPARMLDLRSQSPRFSRERLRTVEEAAAAIGAPAAMPVAFPELPGRAAGRLSALGEVVASLRRAASEEAPASNRVVEGALVASPAPLPDARA